LVRAIVDVRIAQLDDATAEQNARPRTLPRQDRVVKSPAKPQRQGSEMLGLEEGIDILQHLLARLRVDTGQAGVARSLPVGDIGAEAVNADGWLALAIEAQPQLQRAVFTFLQGNNMPVVVVLD